MCVSVAMAILLNTKPKYLSRCFKSGSNHIYSDILKLISLQFQTHVFLKLLLGAQTNILHKNHTWENVL